MLQASESEARAQGHWNATDTHTRIGGPAVSEIFCAKAQNTCTEHKANFDEHLDGTFSLSADTYVYGIDRWTPKELLASQIRGICHIKRTLKIDFTQSRVFFMDSLAEPTTLKECESWRLVHVFELSPGNVYSIGKGRDKK